MSLADALVELQELTERLRRECPWDREQTARTIVPHTVEEAYEVADAALAGDDAKLLDEIGDLLFQSYFLALLLSERGAGDLESAARGIHAKLVSRHPHVFGDGRGPHGLARARPLGGDQARGRGPRGDLPRRARRAARAALRAQGAAAREVRRLRVPRPGRSARRLRGRAARAARRSCLPPIPSRRPSPPSASRPSSATCCSPPSTSRGG